MTKEKDTDFGIELEKARDGSCVIRIMNVTEANFERAYRLADNLLKQAGNIDSELVKLQRVEQARSKVAMYWITREKTRRISDFVSQRSHRIALSLLDAYPDGKTQSQIVEETGVSQPTIHTQLSGKVRSVADYFEQQGRKYFLTEEGVDWLLKEVVPFVSDSSAEE